MQCPRYVAIAIIGMLANVLLLNVKGLIMNTISLKKLSFAVVVASLVSNLAFANDKVMAKVGASVESFSELVAVYDTDKNNQLSAQELANSAKGKNKLTKVFSQIDANGDKQISEEEFTQYIALTKVQKPLS